jgi:hypothetical protein
LNDRLQQIAQNDPRLAPLIQHLQERLTAQHPEPAPAETNEPPQDQDFEATQAARLAKRNKELKRMARSMFDEIQALRARNDMLAAALGACHLCWGEDSECPYCAGAGKVGAYVISLRTFDQVVGPALQQLEQRPRLAQPRPNQ